MKAFDLSLYSKYRGALMGIAILGVMIGHGISWMELRDCSWTKPLGWFQRIAFTEGFLFLSGLGLYYSFRKNSDVRSFYLRRWYRMMLPFMIMALPFYLIPFLLGDTSVIRFLLCETSLYFWFYGNNGMWYISVSLLLYLLFPLLYRFLFRQPEQRGIYLRSLCLVVALFLLCVALHHFAPAYYEATDIGLAKLPMFVLGMLAAWMTCNRKCLTFNQLVGGGILIVLLFFLKRKDEFFVSYYEMSVRLLLMPIACVVMEWLSRRKWQVATFFEWFGRYSLELYVLQMLLITPMKQLLLYAGMDECLVRFLHVAITYALLLLLCAPIHRGIDWLTAHLKAC